MEERRCPKYWSSACPVVEALEEAVLGQVFPPAHGGHQGRADIQAVAHGGVHAEAGSPEELQPMGRTHAEAGEKCEEGRAAERSCYGLIVSSLVPLAAWPGKGGRGVGNEGVKVRLGEWEYKEGGWEGVLVSFFLTTQL